MHRARETDALLTNETPDFINPTLWLPNSPDLNPVDYKTWGCMQEMVYQTKVRDVEDLRKRIMQACEWRKRLRARVEAKGRQIEYKL